MIKADKDDHTRRENTQTQPLRTMKVFNNPDVMTEGWYPICPSRDLKKGKVQSFLVTFQRLAVYRGEDGKVRAMDAFCSHMGADLGNGTVRGNSLECYFHQWRYASNGTLEATRGLTQKPSGICQAVYPTEERYGFVWVYAGRVAKHPVPVPRGFEGQELVAWHIKGPKLYAHHHVMMIGGIDLLHFASVHGLDAKFDYSISENADETADWDIEGLLPTEGWRARCGRFLLGERFRYAARFAGGTIVALTYGREQRWFGTRSLLTPLSVLWGCVADQDGISRVQIFLVTPKRHGLWGYVRSRFALLSTALLLAVLKDDDIKAFPHMRFQISYPTAEDQCALRFVKWVEGLRPSRWSRIPLSEKEVP